MSKLKTKVVHFKGGLEDDQNPSTELGEQNMDEEV